MTAGAYSIPEVQRLVATLVASKPGGRIAEIGTSYGDGAKAIAAALQEGATFVTVELDPDRAARAREALAGTRAEVLQGDWRELLAPRAPFDLLFADGGGSYGDVADLLGPGGILVKDDLTPGRPVAGDATREALLLDPRLEATEVRVTDEMACIVAVRRVGA
ncbi:MAG TPA: class I SAM-dependent methyltransferase [Gaiellaceae bacterium]|jgi:predicted O-methyltransferase YrrM|nr:class I SAM-dependent methyltransferase [Gaiellaceae bacterium]